MIYKFEVAELPTNKFICMFFAKDSKQCFIVSKKQVEFFVKILNEYESTSEYSFDQVRMSNGNYDGFSIFRIEGQGYHFVTYKNSSKRGIMNYLMSFKVSTKTLNEIREKLTKISENR